jgi:hypothetical protein
MKQLASYEEISSYVKWILRKKILNVRLVLVDCVWNVMARAQKPDFVFQRNGRVHLNRRGRQFSRLLAAQVCASAVVMLDTPCPEVVWSVLATHSIRQFPLHFPSRASPGAITFQLDSNRNITVYFLVVNDVMNCAWQKKVAKGAMYIRVTVYCGHLIILWLFHVGISCTVFVLICTGVVLYCFVMCVCVCVRACACACACACVCVFW